MTSTSTPKWLLGLVALFVATAAMAGCAEPEQSESENVDTDIGPGTEIGEEPGEGDFGGAEGEEDVTIGDDS